MSGIYLHIPFCKQACHYCDFHFSTSQKHREAMVLALAKEMILRKAELGNDVVETIYFGGGTPSVLHIADLEFLIATVYENFKVDQNPEITVEANPDDLNADYIRNLAATKVNRLSIGIQSFFEEDLKLMNRAHNAEEAKACLELASTYFDNISIDLIYGIPGMDDAKWRANIETALSFGIPHISSYALTVEPKTALRKLIQTGQIPAPSDEAAHGHFQILMEQMSAHGFVHYELSNFGKEGYFSRNNSAYWLGKTYVGIGPSAHSFNGESRSWNVANNALYLKALANAERPAETEILTPTDRYNEYIMTGLRTIWGVSLERIARDFGESYHRHLRKEAAKFLEQGLLEIQDGTLRTTRRGKFLTDGMASDLFLVNLEE